MFVTALHRRKHMLPWLHKWDFTAESGGTIPDVVNGAGLTLAGTSYTSNSTGVRPTNKDVRASTANSNLLVDTVIGSSDVYTYMVAVSNVYSAGVDNTSGRFFSGYASYGGGRVLLLNATNKVFYAKGGTTYDTITIETLNDPVVVSVDTSGNFRVLVDDTLESGTGAEAYFRDPVYIMNYSSFTDALDALFTGAGILSEVLSEADFRAAAAELLSL